MLPDKAVHEQPLARASLHRQQTGLCRGKNVKLTSPQGYICQDATPALPTRPVQCTPANGAMWLCLTSVNLNAENNEKTCIEPPDRAQGTSGAFALAAGTTVRPTMQTSVTQTIARHFDAPKHPKYNVMALLSSCLQPASSARRRSQLRLETLANARSSAG